LLTVLHEYEFKGASIKLEVQIERYSEKFSHASPQGFVPSNPDFQSGSSVVLLMTFSQGEHGVTDEVSQGELYGYKRIINLI
jgi:hypothetical protein